MFLCNLLGNTNAKFVREGNHQMVATALLYFLAFLVGAEPVLEQPVNSCMPQCPPLSTVFAFIRGMAASSASERACATNMYRTVTYLGAFGAETTKPVQLMHVHAAYAQLKRKRPKACMKTLFKQYVRNGKKKFDGDKRMLPNSQVYPTQFGTAVAKLTMARL